MSLEEAYGNVRVEGPKQTSHIETTEPLAALGVSGGADVEQVAFHMNPINDALQGATDSFGGPSKVG